MRKIIRGFLSVLGSNFISDLLGILFTPIIVRLLGPSKYGDYAYIMSIITLMLVVSRDGISSSMRKFIPVHDNIQWRSSLVSIFSIMGLGSTVILCLLLVFIVNSDDMSSFVGHIIEEYYILIVFCLISELLYYIFRYYFMSIQQEHYSEPLEIIKETLFVLISIYFVYTGLGIAGLLYGWIYSRVSTAIVAIPFVGRQINLNEVLQSNQEIPVKKILSYNSETIIFSILLMSLYHTDILLINRLVGSEGAGIYKAALVITTFLWFVPNTLQTVFIHSTSRMWEKNENQEITELISKTTRYNLLFTALLVIGLSVLADEFIPLYFGNNYTDAVLPLLLLLPGTLGFALSRPIYATIQGQGSIRLLIFSTLFPAIINILLNIILIPRFGINGAAISTSIGYGSMFIFTIYSSKIVGFNPIQDIRAHQIVTTTTLTLISIFLIDYLINSDILTLIVVPPIGFLVFSCLSVITGSSNIDEVKNIFNEVL